MSPFQPKNALKKIDKLYHRALNLVARDIKHLENKILGGKLGAKDSRDLVWYTKMLEDMYKAHQRMAKEEEEQSRQAKTKLTDKELLEDATDQAK